MHVCVCVCVIAECIYLVNDQVKIEQEWLIYEKTMLSADITRMLEATER